MNDRAIDRHSINCYGCNNLIDERESYHVLVKGEEHEICQFCFENAGYTHCEECDITKPDSEINWKNDICKECEVKK